MTRRPVFEDNPPVTLEEQYSCATSTSDLGLPHGPGAGAQGILAAAAWSNVHLGSALLRLRTQWDREKPTRKLARTREQLQASGLSSKDARAEHRRQTLNLAVAYSRQMLAVMRHLQEWHGAHEALTVHATSLGIDDADAVAFAVLGKWLRDPGRKLAEPAELQLWAYLDDCLAHARFRLRESMRGRTNHHPD